MWTSPPSAVDDDGLARFHHGGDAGGLADGRDAERAGDQRHVGGGGAFLHDEAADPRALIVEQLGRAHRAGDEDGIAGDLRQRSGGAAHQLAQEAVRDIVEIVQALADQTVGRAQQAGAIVGLDALDGGLGGEPGAHHVRHLAGPAAILRDHQERLEDVARRTVRLDLVARQVGDEVAADLVERGLEPVELVLHIVGQELGDDDAGLVQHGAAEADALAQRDAGDVELTLDVERGGLLRDLVEVAGAGDLGDHHRGGLQRLDFLVVVPAGGAVLHRQHADHPPGAQHGDAEEGVVVLLTGLRQVGEGGVRARVDDVERLRRLRDAPDQTLADTQARTMHRGRVQAVGGIKLQHGVGPQDIEGGDLRHHVVRDDAHDTVEPMLRLHRRCHGGVQLLDELPRAGERVAHRSSYNRNWSVLTL